MQGYIYILTNNSLKNDFLKIGFTARDPWKRAKELRSTGVPDDYDVAYSQLFDDCKSAEKAIHKKLKAKRSKKDREFFVIPLQEAINAIQSVFNEHLSQKLKSQEEKLTKLSSELTLINTKKWWQGLEDEWKQFLLTSIGIDSTFISNKYGKYLGYSPNDEEVIQIANLEDINVSELPNNLEPLLFLKKIKCFFYELGGQYAHKITEIAHEFPLLEYFAQRHGNLDNIDNFSKCTNLKLLNLDATPVKNLNSLVNLKFLTSLSIEETCVVDLDAVGKIPNLEILSISYNSIKDLKPLLNAKKLKILYFNFGITDSIIPLLQHKALQKVYLCDTLIADNEDIQNHELALFKSLNPKCEVITSWEKMWDN